MIPPFNNRGNLPPGIHQANSWEEIHRQFGTNPRRIEMLDRMRIALDLLKRAGCKKVYLDGSFVTNKNTPNDYDCCYETDGIDENRLDPVFLNITAQGRARQKFLFLGEFFPSNLLAGSSQRPFLDFFQTDRENQGRKGIVELNLEELL